MVEQLRAEGLKELEILQAFDAIPRHHFVAPALQHRAYDDIALPVGFGQTISRPSVHARFLQLAQLQGSEKVLEIGTGSGFQTALLAVLAGSVYSVERIRPLAEQARRRIAELKLTVSIRVGDGTEGWPEEAPFDVILVAAASLETPRTLSGQLADGGMLLIPIGDSHQQKLVLTRRLGDNWEQEEIDRAHFVPLLEGSGP